MLIVILILSTLFCHVIADYNLQGILASMKQKDWWREHSPDDAYRRDWIPAILAHSFMWSCVVMIPTLVLCWNSLSWFWVLFWVVLNTFWHASIDDLKANLNEINLVRDQSLHMVQIGLMLVTPILMLAGRSLG